MGLVDFYACGLWQNDIDLLLDEIWWCLDFYGNIKVRLVHNPEIWVTFWNYGTWHVSRWVDCWRYYQSLYTVKALWTYRSSTLFMIFTVTYTKWTGYAKLPRGLKMSCLLTVNTTLASNFLKRLFLSDTIRIEHLNTRDRF